MKVLLVVVLVLGCIGVVSGVGFGIHDGDEHTCGMEAVAKIRNITRPEACVVNKCDDPDFRNKYAFKGNDFITIPIQLNVLSTDCDSDINNFMTNLDLSHGLYKLAGIQFDVIDIACSPYFKYGNDNIYELAAYSSFFNTWFYQLEAFKKTFAKSPKNALNVFVSGQTRGSAGTLLGIGTFPWDTNALSDVGGLWVNKIAIANPTQDITLAHEAGHNVGLWHTFHGVSEMSSCYSTCYETVHTLYDTAANLMGDMCMDTPAAPLSYNCYAPTENNCRGKKYTDYSGSNDPLFDNIMAYSGNACQSTFTDAQAARSRCYVCNNLESYLDGDKESQASCQV